MKRIIASAPLIGFLLLATTTAAGQTAKYDSSTMFVLSLFGSGYDASTETNAWNDIMPVFGHHFGPYDQLSVEGSNRYVQRSLVLEGEQEDVSQEERTMLNHNNLRGDGTTQQRGQKDRNLVGVCHACCPSCANPNQCKWCNGGSAQNRPAATPAPGGATAGQTSDAAHNDVLTKAPTKNPSGNRLLLELSNEKSAPKQLLAFDANKCEAEMNQALLPYNEMPGVQMWVRINAL